MRAGGRRGPSAGAAPTRAVPTSAELRRAVEALEGPLSRWSELPDDLVLLREVPEGEIVRLERSLSAGLSAHRSAVDPLLQEATAHAWRRSASPQVLRREHEMFEVSMRELCGLITLVREDGHGGNRQALGQYLRLLWEALRRHVRDEEALLETPPDGSRA